MRVRGGTNNAQARPAQERKGIRSMFRSVWSKLKSWFASRRAEQGNSDMSSTLEDEDSAGSDSQQVMLNEFMCFDRAVTVATMLVSLSF
jgi:hypothetical protein